MSLQELQILFLLYTKIQLNCPLDLFQRRKKEGKGSKDCSSYALVVFLTQLYFDNSV